jgi:hypothetical protein
MTCGRDDAACYCPNCDNSFYEARAKIDSALSASPAEPEEATEAMIEAGAALIGGGSTFDHNERREMASEIYVAMRSAAQEAGDR